MLFIISCIVLTSINPDIFDAFTILTDDDAEALKEENERLRGTLESILPNVEKPLFENDCEPRHYFESTFEAVPLAQVLFKGKSLSFKMLAHDPHYLRPIYDSYWKDAYFRRWAYLPYRICDARHNLFVFYGGASSLFDFYGEQSLNIKADIDYHRNINFLVYDFSVKEIKLLDHQIVLIGEPQLMGAQIVAVRVNDVLPKEIDSKNFLFQLSTPAGYEMDYLYGDYGRSDYLKKIEPVSTSALAQGQDDPSLDELKKENTLLRKELSYYVPLEDEMRITEEDCPDRSFDVISRNGDIPKDILGKRIDIPFTIHYSNLQYKRPIYHPAWKKNYRQGWAYVPRKVCDALHNLFIVPTDKEKQADFLGNLAFFEKFQPIDERQIGLLVYDFDIKSIKTFDDQIFITGIPSRTDAQIISINQKYLENHLKYSIYLETMDGFQTDAIRLDKSH